MYAYVKGREEKMCRLSYHSAVKSEQLFLFGTHESCSVLAGVRSSRSCSCSCSRSSDFRVLIERSSRRHYSGYMRALYATHVRNFNRATWALIATRKNTNEQKFV